ncbi:hypothetical protein WJ978_20200 [Achromobacter xylosoxidans]
MVVLVIVAIAASMVSLSVGKGADPLRDDAQRLLDAFTVAEGEARSDGRALRWSPASGGWSFERAGRSDAPTAQDDRPRPWTGWNTTRPCARSPGAPARCSGAWIPTARWSSTPNGSPIHSACGCARAIRM